MGVAVSQAVLLAISPAYILKTGQTFISEGMHFYVFILRKQATGKKIPLIIKRDLVLSLLLETSRNTLIYFFFFLPVKDRSRRSDCCALLISVL